MPTRLASTAGQGSTADTKIHHYFKKQTMKLLEEPPQSPHWNISKKLGRDPTPGSGYEIFPSEKAVTSWNYMTRVRNVPGLIIGRNSCGSLVKRYDRSTNLSSASRSTL